MRQCAGTRSLVHGCKDEACSVERGRHGVPTACQAGGARVARQSRSNRAGCPPPRCILSAWLSHTLHDVNWDTQPHPGRLQALLRGRRVVQVRAVVPPGPGARGRPKPAVHTGMLLFCPTTAWFPLRLAHVVLLMRLRAACVLYLRRAPEPCNQEPTLSTRTAIPLGRMPALLSRSCPYHLC